MMRSPLLTWRRGMSRKGKSSEPITRTTHPTTLVNLQCLSIDPSSSVHYVGRLVGVDLASLRLEFAHGRPSCKAL